MKLTSIEVNFFLNIFNIFMNAVCPYHDIVLNMVFLVGGTTIIQSQMLNITINIGVLMSMAEYLKEKTDLLVFLNAALKILMR